MTVKAETIAAVRGAELHHCTTVWQSKPRYSIVHTCEEQVKTDAELMDKESEERSTEGIDTMDGSEKTNADDEENGEKGGQQSDRIWTRNE